LAASVITTCTSNACCCNARTSSAALYAAMPPETPTVTFIETFYESSEARRNASDPVAIASLENRESGNVWRLDFGLQHRSLSSNVANLARGNLILCHSAWFSRTRCHQRGRSVLKLTRPAGGY